MLIAAALLLAPRMPEDPAGILAQFRDDFVRILPGERPFPRTFSMGCAGESPAERPVHEVTLGAGFRIARTEVPQNLWEAVTGRNPSRWKGVRNAVEQVSFDESVEFCHSATRRMRELGLIGKEDVIRLPSEAEWEYAARAGTKSRYSFGDDGASLGDYAWFTGNAAGNDPPVGKKKPNPWGLFDVHGYVSEWCLDAWHASYEGAPSDGSAWTAGGDGTRRVIRGGSWKDEADRLTCSIRRSEASGYRDDAVGLRCVWVEAERKNP